MKIELNKPALVEDLRAFLQRADCEAEPDGDSALSVAVPDAYGEEQERLELELYLKAWQATHPDVEAHLLETPRPGVQKTAESAD